MANNEDRISRVFEGHHVFVTGGEELNLIFLQRNAVWGLKYKVNYFASDNMDA